MKKLNQDGAMNALLIPLIVATICFFVAAGLSISYYNKFIDQRDRNQPKIEAAVEDAKETQRKQMEADFTEKEKRPTKQFTSPSEFGGVVLTFPKTWSSYVENKGSEFQYYGHPNYVPSEGVNYALRMSVVSRQFAQEIKQYDAQVKKNELKATSVMASGVTGTRLDGFLSKKMEGSMLIFPLRDKTLRVWTESKNFRGDFDNIVLKSFSFVP